MEINYSFIKLYPKYLNLYPSYALIYKMNEYYLADGGYGYANDGWRAVLHIVGREKAPIEYVHKLAKRVGGVRFEGFVGNLADAYSKAGISIVPINKNCGIVGLLPENCTS